VGANGLLGPVDTAIEMTMTAGPFATGSRHGLVESVFSHIPYALIFIGGAIALFAPNTQQIIDGRRNDPFQAPAFGRLRFHYSAATAVAAAAALFFCLTLMSDVREFVYFQF